MGFDQCRTKGGARRLMQQRRAETFFDMAETMP